MKLLQSRDYGLILFPVSQNSVSHLGLSDFVDWDIATNQKQQQQSFEHSCVPGTPLSTLV
jgi:hypothetical protein